MPGVASVLIRLTSAAAGAAAILLTLVPAALGDWTTYHGDAARSGVDRTSGAAVPFQAAWTSPDLGAKIFAQPLVYSGLVFVATEGDDVYALNAGSGLVAWRKHLATAVPNNSLGCGDISPTVGITSTPVIDPGSGELFAVADTWDGSHAHHVLFALRASDGTILGSQSVDPPGTTPEDQLQRAALNLVSGNVIFGYGGNEGDCGHYWGWVASASETGAHPPAYWQAATPTSGEPSDHGGAVWAPGGPVVDGAGFVYAPTGNSFLTSCSSSFDNSDAVVKLSAQMVEQDYFAPSSWCSDGMSDTDLGSAAPELLDGSMLFQAGKNGSGYLVSTTSMGHIGGQLFSAPVCSSYGGDAYVPETIFVGCSNGIRALSLDVANKRFSVAWHGPSDANGPPVVSGGLVWVTAYAGAKLYGLDAASGAARVTQSTPAMEHFTTPAASAGRLYLATGSTVESYVVAAAVPSPGPPQPPPTTPTQPTGAGCPGLRLAIRHPDGTRVRRVTVFLGHSRLAHSRGRNLRQIQVSVVGATTFTLRIVERTSNHRRFTYHLRFNNCRPLPSTRRR